MSNAICYFLLGYLASTLVDYFIFRRTSAEIESKLNDINRKD